MGRKKKKKVSRSMRVTEGGRVIKVGLIEKVRLSKNVEKEVGQRAIWRKSASIRRNNDNTDCLMNSKKAE